MYFRKPKCLRKSNIKKINGGDAKYWRDAYELLVSQTGRDLNDGLGIDPRTKEGTMKLNPGDIVTVQIQVVSQSLSASDVFWGKLLDVNNTPTTYPEVCFNVKCVKEIIPAPPEPPKVGEIWTSGIVDYKIMAVSDGFVANLVVSKNGLLPGSIQSIKFWTDRLKKKEN